jgi:hypothetical protein
MVQNRGTEATEVTEAGDVDLTHQIIGAAIEVHRVLGHKSTGPNYLPT